MIWLRTHLQKRNDLMTIRSGWPNFWVDLIFGSRKKQLTTFKLTRKVDVQSATVLHSIASKMFGSFWRLNEHKTLGETAGLFSGYHMATCRRLTWQWWAMACGGSQWSVETVEISNIYATNPYIFLDIKKYAQITGAIGWSFVRWIWCDMCVHVTFCDKCEREPVPSKSSNPNKKNIAKVQPTNKNQQATYSPTKVWCLGRWDGTLRMVLHGHLWWSGSPGQPLACRRCRRWMDVG